MKTLLSVCLALGVGVALGRMFDGAPAAAAGGPGGGAVPIGNGDVNGDGTIDITDAVYLLANLFTGGAAVKPIECPAVPPAGGLPDTGQSKCYGFVENQGWVEVPCDQAACAGQDGSYATGCPNDASRFVVNDSGTPEDRSDDTVTDTCSGLMWQRDTADVNADGQLTDQDHTSWCNALAYCEDLSFAGHDDWRLPNVRELQSIVDYGRINPSIDPVFGAFSAWYWSSTSYAGYPFFAWGVHFYDGFVFFGDDLGDHSDVRAVRGGP